METWELTVPDWASIRPERAEMGDEGGDLGGHAGSGGVDGADRLVVAQWRHAVFLEQWQQAEGGEVVGDHPGGQQGEPEAIEGGEP